MARWLEAIKPSPGAIFKSGDGQKSPFFWFKMDHHGRLPYQAFNPPGNWIMGQNTPQAMGKDVLGTFMPHPGVIPGPGGSENG